MTVQLPLQEGILTLEQWQHAERLAASLSPEQARWISGYFAGLDAGLLALWRRRNRAPVAARPGKNAHDPLRHRNRQLP